MQDNVDDMLTKTTPHGQLTSLEREAQTYHYHKSNEEKQNLQKSVA